jgi:hypothetical protein
LENWRIDLHSTFVGQNINRFCQLEMIDCDLGMCDMKECIASFRMEALSQNSNCHALDVSEVIFKFGFKI